MERVDDGHVLDVQHRSPVTDLEIDRRLADVERPEETRGKDAAVEVVELRPRTGVKDVDSYQRKRSPVDRTVHQVLSLERPDVGFEVVHRAVVTASGADVISNRGRAVEIGERHGHHVESREGQPGEWQRHARVARRKDVNDETGSQFDSARNRIRYW